MLLWPAHQRGLQRGAEPARDPATAELHRLSQPGFPRFGLIAVRRHQCLTNPQRRAWGVGRLPFCRLDKRLPRQVGATGPHLLARMGKLQLDHALAHRLVDRVQRQEPACETGSLFVSVARHRCVDRMQQDHGVPGKSLGRLIGHAMPVLGTVGRPIVLQQGEGCGQVIGVGHKLRSR